MTSSAPARTESAPAPAPSNRRQLVSWAAALIALVGLGWLLSFTEVEIHSERIKNPNPPNPLPDEGMFGMPGTFWIVVLHTATILICLAMIAAFVRNRRAGGSVNPGLGLFLGLTTIIAYDPIFNWAMYAVYNPALRHWPVDWGWASISPSVEPLWPLGAYPFFFLAPGLIAFALHKRFVLRRASAGSFALRRPLLSLFLFAVPVTLVLECVGESLLLQARIWSYYQYWGPALRLFSHSWLPLTEIINATLTMSLLAMLMHRDDRGRSPSKRIALRLGRDGRIRIGETAVAILLMQAVFIAYIGYFAVIREAGLATNVAGDWPYHSIKVYDPDGYVHRAGIAGPYYHGVWAPTR